MSTCDCKTKRRFRDRINDPETDDETAGALTREMNRMCRECVKEEKEEIE